MATEPKGALGRWCSGLILGAGVVFGILLLCVGILMMQNPKAFTSFLTRRYDHVEDFGMYLILTAVFIIASSCGGSLLLYWISKTKSKAKPAKQEAEFGKCLACERNGPGEDSHIYSTIEAVLGPGTRTEDTVDQTAEAGLFDVVRLT